jgi:hypothetical protein
MYSYTDWENVYSITRICICMLIPNLSSTSVLTMYSDVFGLTIIQLPNTKTMGEAANAPTTFLS